MTVTFFSLFAVIFQIAYVLVYFGFYWPQLWSYDTFAYYFQGKLNTERQIGLIVQNSMQLA